MSIYQRKYRDERPYSQASFFATGKIQFSPGNGSIMPCESAGLS